MITSSQFANKDGVCLIFASRLNLSGQLWPLIFKWRLSRLACLNGVGAMHFLLSTVVKHVLKFKYGWCNAPLVCSFLHMKPATALTCLSHHNSICLSVCPSVMRVDQSKTVQAWITKSSRSAAWKTLVSGTIKLFHKFKGGRLERGC